MFAEHLTACYLKDCEMFDPISCLFSNRMVFNHMKPKKVHVIFQITSHNPFVYIVYLFFRTLLFYTTILQKVLYCQFLIPFDFFR